ncbi:hypothetical protein TSOC_001666 [Tetrabaena socialis]|uniref:Hexosyltransferase n=1 Tax=Tetrabaena socialis TaxID=47790 RepID=A0A2J8AGA6_9CHLO|nr:hypothetical protein TSOC_001666 [Tetrabaena socialis]|eukprot:PNH11547.1 hypothetical protein TSOC_001666 [Tetrabaena socialis]
MNHLALLLVTALLLSGSQGGAALSRRALPLHGWAEGAADPALGRPSSQGSAVRGYLAAHPDGDPWEFMARPRERARALAGLRRLLPPYARSLRPIRSNLSVTARRLSDPAHQRTAAPLLRPASAASPPGAAPYGKHDYQARRQVLRRTWLAEAAQYDHVVARFVVGGGSVQQGAEGRVEDGDRGGGQHAAAAAALAEEAALHGDMLLLEGVADSYFTLSLKSRAFFAVVLRLFPSVEWIIKSDDDVYLMPPRLLMAADQWAAGGAE